jgi:two-component system nitrogen regulation sensor histidine kinase NtrY
MKSVKKIMIPQADSWLLVSGLLVCLPISILSLVLIWTHSMTFEWQWTLTTVVLVMLIWLPWYLHIRLIEPLRSISNAVLSLKDGDFSINLDQNQHQGILQQTAVGLNQLTEQLYNTRTDAAETHELLKKVLRQIDVAVLTFNSEFLLMGINDRGLQLLRQSRTQVIGQSAEALGLAHCLEGSEGRTEVLDLIAPQGVWQMRRSNFREKGKNHILLTLADLTAVMRQQELSAWQRMMRVLRHEISNSLAPVQSYAQTISWLIEQQPLPDNWLSESREGLEVIVGRTKALTQLMNQHQALTDLPKPQLAQVAMTDLLKKAIKLQTQCPVNLSGDNEQLATIIVEVDGEQINQLLLNLLKNAGEAMAEKPGEPPIEISWTISQAQDNQSYILLHIDDQGPGLASFDNLFVPFYTTKPNGSGIGLALCRQIAGAHQGFLHLKNRDCGGCRATLSLPVVESPTN